MTKNVGQIDKGIRMIVGLALIGFTLMGTIGAWGWIGAVLLATGLVGWCPAYYLTHMNTHRSIEHEPKT